uniref:Mediator of RNA polymerase II transcription subunit 16 n=1 Tax=Glycine max TaxID=3847 RepID=A0A0R0FX46_SOYBN
MKSKSTIVVCSTMRETHVSAYDSCTVNLLILFPGAVSWCGKLNAIACPSETCARIPSSTGNPPFWIPIHIVIPERPTECAVFNVIADSPRDSVQFIEWSPTCCPHALLIANFHGRVTIWAQPSQVTNLALDASCWLREHEWQQDIAVVTKWLSGYRWLSSKPSAPANSRSTFEEKFLSRQCQTSDSLNEMCYIRHSCHDDTCNSRETIAKFVSMSVSCPVSVLVSLNINTICMLMVVMVTTMAMPEIKTPNFLCVCSVFSSGSVQLHWSQWPPQNATTPKWFCTSKGPLGCGPCGIMAGDAIITDSGTMLVTGVPIVNPSTIVVWEVMPGPGNGFQYIIYLTFVGQYMSPYDPDEGPSITGWRVQRWESSLQHDVLHPIFGNPTSSMGGQPPMQTVWQTKVELSIPPTNDFKNHQAPAVGMNTDMQKVSDFGFDKSKRFDFYPFDLPKVHIFSGPNFAPVDNYQISVGSAIAAPAFSSTSCCSASVWHDTSKDQTILKIIRVLPHAIPTSQVKANSSNWERAIAERFWWSLLVGVNWWDAVGCTQSAAEDGIVSLNSVIAVLDADFHSLPSAQHRQHYCPMAMQNMPRPRGADAAGLLLCELELHPPAEEWHRRNMFGGPWSDPDVLDSANDALKLVSLNPLDSSSLENCDVYYGANGLWPRKRRMSERDAAFGLNTYVGLGAYLGIMGSRRDAVTALWKTGIEGIWYKCMRCLRQTCAFASPASTNLPSQNDREIWWISSWAYGCPMCGGTWVRVWHPPNFVTCSAPSMDHIRRQGENACGGDYFLVGPKRLKLTEHDKLLNKFLGTGELWCLCWEGIILGNVFAVMEELVSRRKLLKKCVSNLDLEKLVLL